MAKSLGIDINQKQVVSDYGMIVLCNYLKGKKYCLTQPKDKSVYVIQVKIGVSQGVKFLKKYRTPYRNYLKLFKSKVKHYGVKVLKIAKVKILLVFDS